MSASEIGLGEQPSDDGRIPSQASPFSFLYGGGEMGILIRQKDWTQTALGAPADWPQSLRSAVSICLGSGFPIAIYWGPTLALLYNDAWSPIPGAKHPWSMGQPAREVWPEIWDTIGPLFQHVIDNGEATRSKDQLLAMRRHGYTEECYFDYTFSPIRGESGRVEGIFNAVLETTQRVIGERRLSIVRELAGRVSKARTVASACDIAAQTLSHASEDIPFALLYLLLEDGTEAQLAGTVGFTEGTPARDPSITLRAGASTPGVWPVAQVVRTGEAELVEDLTPFAPLPKGPWPELPRCAIVLPVARGGSDRLYGVLVAGVSARRSLDKDYRAFLDIVTNHISQALANAQAYEEERQRAEALAEIDRAKTAFFSNVSHEFRTPLTLMLGPLEEMLAMNDALPHAVTDLVSVTHRNGLRLQKLVNSLLDFSRIEAGRMQASYEPTDLAAATRELASTFRSAIEKAGLELILECEPMSEDVFVDREMWEKIVLNLLSNAFKYTFEGKIKVRLSEERSTTKLAIEDTGIGIAKEELPHLFERFHRVEGARGRTQEGSGIGLALVAELVKMHGGTLEVASKPGQGSTFTVVLPLGAAHLPAEHVGQTRRLNSTVALAQSYATEAGRWSMGGSDSLLSERRGAGPADEKPRPRVLVADDNADMREYVVRLLTDQYEVTAVEDGEQALQSVLRDAPDLLVSDVMMPGLDGFNLLQTIRSNPTTRALPVILLSARAGEEARVEGLNAGANDYLVKPFTARELLARIAAHLEMARVRQDLQQSNEELKRVNRELEEFAYIAGHDLQEPLRMTNIYTQLIVREIGGREEKLDRYASYVQRGVTKMETLIRDLLQFSRATHTDALPVGAADLSTSLTEALSVLKTFVKESGATITVRQPLPKVRGDTAQMAHVFQNLLSNAIKYRRAGAPLEIEISAEREGENWTVSMRDNGIGFLPQHAEQIFGLFKRLHRDEYPGTGLGLALCKRIVERYGGRIWAMGRPDQGAIFHFSLSGR